MSGLRRRKRGVNCVSDRYTVLFPVDARYRDLGLFIAHTGFADIQTRATICPNEHTFTSLEVAWRLVNQGYQPVFVTDRMCFKIVPRADCTDMLRTLQLNNVLYSQFDTSFRPRSSNISVDSVITRILTRDPSTAACQIHRALRIVLPVSFYISRSTVSYRMKKYCAGHLVVRTCANPADTESQSHSSPITETSGNSVTA
jgi:hypothetical protein